MNSTALRLAASLLASAALLQAIGDAIAQEVAAENASTLTTLSRRNSLVAATLEQPRETAAQILSAVGRLLDLGQQEAASLILPELLQAELDEVERAALVNRFGTARFMQLVRLDNPDHEDGGGFEGARQFAQSCLDAAATAVQDPAVIERLIQQLIADDSDTRTTAISDLRTTGLAGVSGCLTALARHEDETARGRLLLALASTRPAVDAPLLAALASGRGRFRRDVVELAGHIRLPGALPWLAALAASPKVDAVAMTARNGLVQFGASTLPTAGEAELLVRREIDEALAGVLPTALARDSGRWLHWDDEAQRLESLDRTIEDLRLLAAARLARAYDDLGGASLLENKRKSIILALEEAALLERQPAPNIVTSIETASPADLSELFALASGEGHIAAAAEIATELGARGDILALVTADGRPSPLVQALDSANRLLRFAALRAVMRINPQAPFPGSSRVVEALWSFALSSGDPTAVAASPIATQATTWAGQLVGLGFDAAATETGRATLREAVNLSRSPRLALVVLDDRIASPPLREVVYQLRANRRTSAVPVIVMCASDRLSALRDMAEADPLLLVAPRPDSDDVMTTLVERALALTDASLLAPETRLQQAEQALTWIQKLNEDGAPYDELMREADLLSETLYAAELTESSLSLLASVGAAAAQQSLVNYASLQSLPLESRRSAVEAFATNVRRLGMQLTRSQVLQQYDRYNSSEKADRETQQLLSRVLDVIEGTDQP